jgi:hypothetical protein
MRQTNDTNSEAATPSASAGKSAAAPSPTGPGSQDMAPIFESFVYEFFNTGLGGGVGRPGTIGGPIDEQMPKYRVLTYPFLPRQVPDIEKS